MDENIIKRRVSLGHNVEGCDGEIKPGELFITSHPMLRVEGRCTKCGQLLYLDFSFEYLRSLQPQPPGTATDINDEDRKFLQDFKIALD
jgi:hypothetical protein